MSVVQKPALADSLRTSVGVVGGIVRDRGTWLVDKLGVTTHSHSFEENCGGGNVKNDVIG